MLSHAVVTPPASLPVNLATIRNHCRVTHAYDDSVLALYAEAATATIEAYTSRSLISQTLLMTSTSTLTPLSVPMSAGPVAVFPLWFPAVISSVARRIELIRTPVQSVNSITITQPSGVTVTLDASAYHVDTDTDPGAVLLTGYTLLPLDRMTVSYVAGYGTTDTAVPAPLRNAVLLLTAHLYTHRGDDDAPGDIPAYVRALVNPYRITHFGTVSADGR